MPMLLTWDKHITKTITINIKSSFILIHIDARLVRALLSFRHILLFFFFNDTAPTEIYTLSLHDALPILGRSVHGGRQSGWTGADDGYVVRVGAQRRCHQAEGARQILLRRVLEHRAVWDDDDRELARVRGEPREQ